MQQPTICVPLYNKGEYSVVPADNKTKDYPLFITTFEKFWSRYKTVYLTYFDKNLFSLMDDTIGQGMI